MGRRAASNSLMVTFCRLPIVTISDRFSVLGLIADGQTDGIGLAKGDAMY